MEFYIRNVGQLAGAMEITKYPNSPLVKSNTGKSVLVAYDGTIEYILGYITKSDVSNPVVMYSQHVMGGIGHVLNDTYNMVQNPDDLSTTSTRKNRTVLVGESQFIGVVFQDGVEGSKYGFRNKNWYVTKNYGGDSGQEAPVSPNKDDEHHFISLDNGNKLYQSASGSLQESNALRVNIGVGGTDIYSYGTWDKATLVVETPIERLERAITSGTYASGARTGFADPSTYHVFNFADNSSFFMGSSIIEIDKASADNSTFAKTIWDADGVLITTDSGSKVIIDVNGTKLTIEDGTVTVLGTMVYDGSVTITGNLEVTGTTDLTGKLTTIGGNELA